MNMRKVGGILIIIGLLQLLSELSWGLIALYHIVIALLFMGIGAFLLEQNNSSKDNKGKLF